MNKIVLITGATSGLTTSATTSATASSITTVLPFAGTSFTMVIVAVCSVATFCFFAKFDIIRITPALGIYIGIWLAGYLRKLKIIIPTQ